MKTTLMFALMSLAMLAKPAFATDIASTRETVSRLAGAIQQTTQPVVPNSATSMNGSKVAQEAGTDDGVIAVCLTTKDSAESCGSSFTAQLPARVAVCDLDDVGLSGCLARHAASLVNHGPRARQAFAVTLQYPNGFTDHTEVLLPLGKSQRDAERYAMESYPGTVALVSGK